MGDFTDFGTRFLIRIHPRCSDDAAALLLIHEWAHARCSGLVGCHTIAWAREYARCYRACYTH